MDPTLCLTSLTSVPALIRPIGKVEQNLLSPLPYDRSHIFRSIPRSQNPMPFLYPFLATRKKANGNWLWAGLEMSSRRRAGGKEECHAREIFATHRKLDVLLHTYVRISIHPYLLTYIYIYIYVRTYIRTYIHTRALGILLNILSPSGNRTRCGGPGQASGRTTTLPNIQSIPKFLPRCLTYWALDGASHYPDIIPHCHVWNIYSAVERVSL
ncbi:hypothetical protein F4859DRAFT_10736 [Xylaria cf. heliscus]|nr:hypothetical protein F4859DRAFT_10736 [Xylaria cf. heliscus]